MKVNGIIRNAVDASTKNAKAMVTYATFMHGHLDVTRSCHNHGSNFFETLMIAFLQYICVTGYGHNINLQVFDHIGSLKLRNEMDTDKLR